MKVRPPAGLPVRRAILERKTYEAPAEGRAGKIRLDFNENTSGCSQAALRAIRRLTPQQLAMYPEYGIKTASLAEMLGVRPDELLLTNGGDDALRVFFDVFGDPRGSILIIEPTFPMYRYYAEIYGMKIRTLRYGKGMEFPLAECLAALRKKPRILFIASPNNPTGTLIEPAAIRKILAATDRTAVAIDEAYAEFSGVTMIPWIRRYPHLFIARTFSKASGLAGLRLGAVIAGRGSVALVRRAMPPFPVNVAALVAAEAALREGKTLRRYVRGTQQRREALVRDLQSLGVTTYPTSANFLLADFGPGGPALFRALERRHILVRDRSHDMGPGFVRISIGTAAEMNRLLAFIRRHYHSQKGKR